MNGRTGRKKQSVVCRRKQNRATEYQGKNTLTSKAVDELDQKWKELETVGDVPVSGPTNPKDDTTPLLA